MKPWTRPTNQELFDNAALGIRWQGFKRATIPGTLQCFARAPDGARCALGHSCTDVRVGAVRSPQWSDIVETELGCALVEAHDGRLKHGKGAWFEYMVCIALAFGLDDSALYFTEKDTDG